MDNSLLRARKLFTSKIFLLVLFTVACLITSFSWEVAGVAVFALLISFLLVYCDDILATTAPFLIMTMFVIKCYDSFSTFIKLWWIALPVAFALIFHFVKYHKKAVIGKCFFGLCAVAVAVTLGGVGTIKPSDYFNGVSLYYIAALGVGMVASYLLLSGELHKERDYDIKEYFSLIMLTMALFGCFMAVQYYIVNIYTVIETGKLLEAQWGNNCSTFLMITMPFAFYYPKNRFLRFGISILIVIALVLCGSRGGILLGTLEYLVCLVVYCFIDRKIRVLNIIVLSCIAVGSIIVGLILYDDILLFMLENDFIPETEPRLLLMKRAATDLLSNPVFGSGLGYSGNNDIYNPVKFAMHWYHSAPMQITGSLGILGIAAYLYQIITRTVAALSDKCNTFNITVLMSFAGLWMMSLVNPGIFCPLPYEFLMVFAFLIVESGNINVKHKSPKGTKAPVC